MRRGINFRNKNITYFHDILLDLIARSKIKGKQQPLLLYTWRDWRFIGSLAKGQFNFVGFA